MEFRKADILGVRVAALTMGEAVKTAEAFMDSEKPHLIATANAEMIMRATHDTELKEILNTADLVVPDGAGTVWASNYLGVQMPERVAGFDLVQALFANAPAKKRRIFFFGSAPGVAEKAKAKAEKDYPGIQIVGTRDGFFTAEDEAEIIAQIKEAKPDLLLAALGVPKQEKWLKAHMQELNCPLCIGVGGTFDVMAGVMKRAPLWMQKAKLEWLFRGMLQPKRIGRLMALPRFVMIICLWTQHLLTSGQVGQKLNLPGYLDVSWLPASSCRQKPARWGEWSPAVNWHLPWQSPPHRRPYFAQSPEWFSALPALRRAAADGRR